ncbi:MAG TPA: hypothetical protein VH597_02360 [Verrucomicrobiae bacterium]|jgi:hypothetical protein|nr:hypothetical protein [Verrucomicrobiae bacterium]
MALVSILSLFLMTYVDYATGYELVFSAAYLLPSALCAWFLSRRAVWFMSASSGVAAFCVDVLSGASYSHFMIRYWNSLMCFVISLITGLLLHRLKCTLEERKKMNIDLQTALDDLKRSTEEITKLQSGLQVVCAWTKQIKVDDQWMTPDEFLSSRLHLKISHGMSPKASREFEDKLKRKAELEKLEHI